MFFNIIVRYHPKGIASTVYILVTNQKDPRHGRVWYDTFNGLYNAVVSLGVEKDDEAWRDFRRRIDFVSVDVSDTFGEKEYSLVDPPDDVKASIGRDLNLMVMQAVDRYKLKRNKRLDEIRKEISGRKLERYEACKLVVCVDIDTHRDSLIKHFNTDIEKVMSRKAFEDKFNAVRRRWLSETCGETTKATLRATAIFYVTCLESGIRMKQYDLSEFTGVTEASISRMAKEIGVQTDVQGDYMTRRFRRGST